MEISVLSRGLASYPLPIHYSWRFSYCLQIKTLLSLTITILKRIISIGIGPSTMSSASRDRIITIIVLVLVGSILFAYWLHCRRRPKEKEAPERHKLWFGQIDCYSGDHELYSVTTSICGGTTSSDLLSGSESSEPSEGGQGYKMPHLRDYGPGEILVTTTVTQYTNYSRDDRV